MRYTVFVSITKIFMSEIPEITPTFGPEKPSEARAFRPNIDYKTSEETIARLASEVMSFLSGHGIDPSKVLLAGFNADHPIQKGSEHWPDDKEAPLFHFGNIRSLTPPQAFAGDGQPEIEHWVVNPLLYAIEGGSLAIYDKQKLDELSGGSLPDDPEEEAAFGTYAYEVAPELLEQAKIAQLQIQI